jgi:hypothetical protein
MLMSSGIRRILVFALVASCFPWIVSCSHTSAQTSEETIIHWTDTNFTVRDFRVWLGAFRLSSPGVVDLVCGVIRAHSSSDEKVLTIIRQSYVVGPEAPVPNSVPRFGQVPAKKDVQLMAHLIEGDCNRSP